jgi:DnaJ-class molecular chaperone
MKNVQKMSKQSDRSKNQDAKVRQNRPDENIVALQGKLYFLMPKGVEDCETCHGAGGGAYDGPCTDCLGTGLYNGGEIQPGFWTLPMSLDPADVV